MTPGTNLILGANYLFSTNDGITIIAVASDAEDDVGTNRIVDFGNVGAEGYGLFSGANADGDSGTDNAFMYTSLNHGGQSLSGPYPAAPDSGTIVIMRMKFSPAADKHMSIHVNGNLAVLNTSHTVTQLTASEIAEATTRGAAMGPVTIGGQSKTNSETGRFMNGNLSLLLWFDRALTDDELRGYECFASLKYGITVPQDCI